MPQQRYVKIKGKPGVLVSNPWALGAQPYPQFAGKRRDPILDGEPEHADRYRDVEEVLASHNDLLKAAAKGDLAMMGQCVAMSADEARSKLSAPAEAPKPKKGS